MECYSLQIVLMLIFKFTSKNNFTMIIIHKTAEYIQKLETLKIKSIFKKTMWQ